MYAPCQSRSVCPYQPAIEAHVLSRMPVLGLQGNQKWCCGDMPHFDLGNKAFAKLAPQVGGVWQSSRPLLHQWCQQHPPSWGGSCAWIDRRAPCDRSIAPPTPLHSQAPALQGMGIIGLKFRPIACELGLGAQQQAAEQRVEAAAGSPWDRWGRSPGAEGATHGGWGHLLGLRPVKV